MTILIELLFNSRFFFFCSTVHRSAIFRSCDENRNFLAAALGMQTLLGASRVTLLLIQRRLYILRPSMKSCGNCQRHEWTTLVALQLHVKDKKSWRYPLREKDATFCKRFLKILRTSISEKNKKSMCGQERQNGTWERTTSRSWWIFGLLFSSELVWTSSSTPAASTGSLSSRLNSGIETLAIAALVKSRVLNTESTISCKCYMQTEKRVSGTFLIWENESAMSSMNGLRHIARVTKLQRRFHVTESRYLQYLAGHNTAPKQYYQLEKNHHQ